jgi:hypothetical protein
VRPKGSDLPGLITLAVDITIGANGRVSNKQDLGKQQPRPQRRLHQGWPRSIGAPHASLGSEPRKVERAPRCTGARCHALSEARVAKKCGKARADTRAEHGSAGARALELVGDSGACCHASASGKGRAAPLTRGSGRSRGKG